MKYTVTNANDFGCSPDLSGIDNSKALQKALDLGGTIIISQPGVYNISKTLYIKSYTTLICENGVFLRKSNELGEFSHMILNIGALTNETDTNITLKGMNLIVNNIDIRDFKDIFGLHGQIAFLNIRHLKIEDFFCDDVGEKQYTIHICSFEDLYIKNAHIKGGKDGIHLDRGKRFHITDCTFETLDDAIALNAHDWDVGTPKLGCIEDGIIENCFDLSTNGSLGYFCRMLCGAWIDWYSGMEVMKSDTVVANGMVYRVKCEPNGEKFISTNVPTHKNKIEVVDGIEWIATQDDILYNVGVRNISFRNIFLYNARTSFAMRLNSNQYSRSYYKGATLPLISGVTFDNIRVLTNDEKCFLEVTCPVSRINISNSNLEKRNIIFENYFENLDFGETELEFSNCILDKNNIIALKEKFKKVSIKID